VRVGDILVKVNFRNAEFKDEEEVYVSKNEALEVFDRDLVGIYTKSGNVTADDIHVSCFAEGDENE
jgi:hypothetical protein